MEAAAWYWIKGTTVNLNDYCVAYGDSIEVFLVTQYFVNGYPDGIDNDLKKIREGDLSYTIELPVNKGDMGKLKINGHVYRLPYGWELREKSYHEAKKAFP